VDEELSSAYATHHATVRRSPAAMPGVIPLCQLRQLTRNRTFRGDGEAPPGAATTRVANVRMLRCVAALHPTVNPHRTRTLEVILSLRVFRGTQQASKGGAWGGVV
jgi:hypothetical protein